VIESHKKKSNIGAGVWLASMAVLVGLILSGQVEGNIWDGNNPLAAIVFIINGLSMGFALWFYAKAKGYWGILGLALIFLSIIGLLILAVLPDRRKEATEQ
jgi:hypothetical protein